MRDDLPSWRSLLFVPVTAEKFVRTGADRGADGSILDLEDAVSPSAKAAAREALVATPLDPATTVVRINATESGFHADDLLALRQTPYRLGIEEELLLVDPVTLRLANRASELRERVAPAAGTVTNDVYEALIELSTPVVGSAGEGFDVLVRHSTLLSAPVRGARGRRRRPR